MAGLGPWSWPFHPCWQRLGEDLQFTRFKRSFFSHGCLHTIHKFLSQGFDTYCLGCGKIEWLWQKPPVARMIVTKMNPSKTDCGELASVLKKLWRTLSDEKSCDEPSGYPKCLWQFWTPHLTGSDGIIPSDDLTDQRILKACRMYLATAPLFACS